MTIPKQERLVNLVALLRYRRRPVTAAEIRARVEGYGQPNDETFRRMFERDKKDLRDAGIPIEVVQSSDGSDGYVLPADATLDVSLTAEEFAAVSLAAQAWIGSMRAEDATLARLKLAAASGAGASAGGWLLPGVDAADPNLAPLFEAVRRRKTIEFAYHPPGRERSERQVEPHRIVFKGAWYLDGRDHLRDRDWRRFKVLRIEGAVRVSPGDSPDFDPESVPSLDPESAPRASIAVAPEAASWALGRAGAEDQGERTDGWTILSLPVPDRQTFLAWLMGFGAEAELLAPPDLRDEALRRLLMAAGEGS